MYTLYHNPRCGKSRTCLSHLQVNAIEFQLKPYLQTGLDSQEVLRLMDNYAGDYMDLIRSNEAIWKTLDTANLTREKAAQLLQEHPILLQRPLVVTLTKTFIVRSPEAIAALDLSI